MRKLRELMQAQFVKMCATGMLFKSEITGIDLWNMYLKSFHSEHNPVFRDPKSSTHNCNHCNNFIRRYGNVVAVDSYGNIMTIYDIDFTIEVEEYIASFRNMSHKIKNSKIANVFFETFDELNSLPYEKTRRNQQLYKLGISENYKKYTKAEADLYGVVSPGELRTFDHMSLALPKQFVDFSGNSIESIQAFYRDKKEVFERAMEEIPGDTLHLVKDLIKQNSLLDGEAHLDAVERMIEQKGKYELCKESKSMESWFWVYTHDLPERIAKFKNTLIGVLCTEIAEGVELNKACESWNKRVDPKNYMKAVAPITETQKQLAKAFVEENGYVESFDRRFATLDDIKVTEIKHINVGDGDIKEVSIFDDIKTKSTRHKRSEFDKIQEISIENFMQDVLPECTSVEVLLENRLENNFVSLTTSNDENAKQIFKWDNPYSWTYKGNLAGKSQIKDAVKSQGGRVDGVLRFSIMWSEENSQDNSDLDAHCKEPDGNTIYYGTKTSQRTKGNLDIDIQTPLDHKRRGNRDVVENITYPELRKMDDGVYIFKVHQFAPRGSEGFKAEIEFDGEVHEYEYNTPVRGTIDVAKVTLRNGQFSIEHILPSATASKEIYNLESGKFHKAKLVCLSPNHWGDNKVGNKNYFFMLDGAKTDEDIRSFHAENLLPDLAKHRKVLEVLGNVNMLEPAEDQLTGLGFNATVSDELIVRIKGSFKRVLKLKF